MDLDLRSSRTLLWPTALAAVAVTAVLLLLFAAVGAGSGGPAAPRGGGTTPAAAAGGPDVTPEDVPSGAVLVFRHALTDRGQTDADPTARGGCDQQRNLSAAGIAQAERIGEGLRQLAAPVRPVLVSPFCRTLDTAVAFGVGPVRAAEELVSTTSAIDAAAVDAIVAAGLDLAAQQLGGEDIAVLVTHTQNIEGLTGGVAVDEGDAVVLVPPDALGATMPDGATGVGILGVVPADAW